PGGKEMIFSTGPLLHRFAVPGGAASKTITDDRSRVEAIALHRDGKTVALTEYGGTVRFWDADRLEALFRRELRQIKINAAAWTPDGRFLVLGGAALPPGGPLEPVVGGEIRLLSFPGAANKEFKDELGPFAPAVSV